MMKQRTSNPSFYFPTEVGIPKVEGLVQHYAASPPLSYNRPCLPVNDLFLSAVMIKIWAVIIINSTHLKTADCFLAYSLGEKKTNTNAKTFQLHITAYLITIPTQIP